MSQQAHIARGLMASWREGQGKRAANGIPEIFRALEFIARGVAEAESWKADPRPVVLTRGQVRLAQKRAISQRRRAEHGPPGHSPDAWWDQIKAIADRWGIEAAREDWETGTRVAASSKADAA